LNRDANAPTPFEIATFNLIGALIDKLTGQRPSVHVMLEDGSVLTVYPNLGQVEWPR